MARNRQDFTNNTKAEIFARDRATCCFSGINLWLLDSPLHAWEANWTDHMRPASRGGSNKAENGVCASYTFNAKKRNNSADTEFLFSHGHPTPLYYRIFGPPSPTVMARLQRLSKLTAADWFFNQAITWTMYALDYRCWGKTHMRDDNYWFKAAFTKLEVFRKKGDPVEDRFLIQSPTETQALLLSIQHCVTLPEIKKIALKLAPIYNRNLKIWNEYFHPEEFDNPAMLDSQRGKAYKKACKQENLLDPKTFSCIQNDYVSRFDHP